MARVESEQVTGELGLVRRHQGWMDGHVGWGDIKMQKREKYARFGISGGFYVGAGDDEYDVLGKRNMAIWAVIEYLDSLYFF